MWLVHHCWLWRSWHVTFELVCCWTKSLNKNPAFHMITLLEIFRVSCTEQTHLERRWSYGIPPLVMNACTVCVCSCKHKCHYTYALYYTVWIFGRGKVWWIPIRSFWGIETLMNSYLFAFFIVHINTSYCRLSIHCTYVCMYIYYSHEGKWGWMNYIYIYTHASVKEAGWTDA